MSCGKASSANLGTGNISSEICGNSDLFSVNWEPIIMGIATCCREWGKESTERERESLLILLMPCVTPATPSVAMVPSQVAGMWQVAPHSNNKENLSRFPILYLLIPSPASCWCILFLPTLSSKRGDDAQSSSSLEPANALPCASDLLVVTSFLLCCIAWNLWEGH